MLHTCSAIASLHALAAVMSCHQRLAQLLKNEDICIHTSRDVNFSHTILRQQMIRNYIRPNASGAAILHVLGWHAPRWQSVAKRSLGCTAAFAVHGLAIPTRLRCAAGRSP